MERRDFLRLSSGMLAALALSSRRFAQTSLRIDAAWYRRSRRFAELPVGRVAYVEHGRGPAALFVHGYPLNGFQWRGALERLHVHRRCIAPDVMGMGFTQTPKGQTISPETQATMLAMLLDALRVGAVDLVANDSGGLVAQLFLANYPQRVRTLLLTNCDVDENSPPPQFMPFIEQARKGIFVDNFIVPQLKDKQLARSAQGMGGLAYTHPESLSDDTIETYFRPLVESDLKKAQVNEYAVSMGTNSLVSIREDLRRWHGPARMVWGLRDALFPVKWAEWLDRTLPGSRREKSGRSKSIFPRRDTGSDRRRSGEAVGDRRPAAGANYPMISNRTITVFGAYGHTGRFVVSELCKRGWTPILSGRDHAKLNTVGHAHQGLEVRVATVNDPASLDHAVSGAAAVINCAGPFIDTAAPVIEAALRSRIHYLDVAAEQPSVLAVFERFAEAASNVGVVIAPAMGFYGGLGDLLATEVMGGWAAADEICVAVALDSWQPTRGTRLTGQRNSGQHFIFSKNRLERADPPPGRIWNFPAPFGPQNVEGLSLAETVLISRHLQTPEIRAYINVAPLTDIRNPDTPAPSAVDESGRSSQVFVMDVIARRGSQTRRTVARGRDIYAITAPIVVEATERVVKELAKMTGVVAAGEVFDARDFLRSLSPAHLSFEI